MYCAMNFVCVSLANIVVSGTKKKILIDHESYKYEHLVLLK